MEYTAVRKEGRNKWHQYVAVMKLHYPIYIQGSRLVINILYYTFCSVILQLCAVSSSRKSERRYLQKKKDQISDWIQTLFKQRHLHTCVATNTSVKTLTEGITESDEDRRRGRDQAAESSLLVLIIKKLQWAKKMTSWLLYTEVKNQ